MAAGVTLFPCQLCDVGGTEKEGGKGHRLGALLREAAAGRSDVRVQPIGCLGGCEKPCSVGVAAPGKCSYVYTGLQPDAASVAALLEYAAQYAAAPLGVVRQLERPPLLRNNVLVRIPPHEWVSETGVMKLPE